MLLMTKEQAKTIYLLLLLTYSLSAFICAVFLARGNDFVNFCLIQYGVMFMAQSWNEVGFCDWVSYFSSVCSSSTNDCCKLLVPCSYGTRRLPYA